jgi:hypothetical protein
MRRLLVIFALASALGGATVALVPQASCAMGLCNAGNACWNSSNCLGDCVCLKQGSVKGTCVGLD